jgi:3-oxoacyl-[acyl-carrier protein] reductase
VASVNSRGNNVAFVLGGTRGIGRACVHALLGQGFDVFYTYCTQPEAAATLQKQLASEFPRARIACTQADVRDAAATANAFDVARDAFGPELHCVVVNAGINRPPRPVHDSDPEVFRELVEINLIGAYNALREAGRRIADGGAIIALSTSLVRYALPGIGLYTATKAATESLVRAMARELSPRGVRVNAVAPGPVDTDLFRAGKTDEARAAAARMSPLNRVGTAEEIAAVVSFLASPAASWVQGQVIQPNGGLV